MKSVRSECQEISRGACSHQSISPAASQRANELLTFIRVCRELLYLGHYSRFALRNVGVLLPKGHVRSRGGMNAEDSSAQGCIQILRNVQNAGWSAAASGHRIHSGD